MSKDKRYKGETFTGRTYWEDADGNREYEGETFTGRKYREDGNRKYENETFTGRKYREDEFGNKTFEDEMTIQNDWTGRLYEKKANFFDKISDSNNSFSSRESIRDKTTNSNAFNSGLNFGENLVGNFFSNFLVSGFVGVGIFFIGLLPIVAAYSILDSDENVISKLLIKPLEAIKKHFIIAYLLNTLLWFKVFTFNNFFAIDGLSPFWGSILGLLHPLIWLFAILVSILLDIYGGLKLIALLNIQYYFIGIVIIFAKYLFNKYKERNI